MSERVGYFEEGQPGNKSINRVMCFLCLLASFGTAAVTLFSAPESWVGYYLTLTFLGFAIAGKNAGKFIEMGFAAKK